MELFGRVPGLILYEFSLILLLPRQNVRLPDLLVSLQNLNLLLLILQLTFRCHLTLLFRYGLISFKVDLVIICILRKMSAVDLGPESVFFHLASRDQFN